MADKKYIQIILKLKKFNNTKFNNGIKSYYISLTIYDHQTFYENEFQSLLLSLPILLSLLMLLTNPILQVFE